MKVVLNLEAKSHNEEIVLNYLKETATDLLAEKINNGKKTLQGCWKYIIGEAKKKAIEGCACIEDREVFGWATHYFWEDAIEECTTAPAIKKVTTTTENAPKKPAPKKEKRGAPSEGQLSIFDMFEDE